MLSEQKKHVQKDAFFHKLNCEEVTDENRVELIRTQIVFWYIAKILSRRTKRIRFLRTKARTSMIFMKFWVSFTVELY